MSEPRYMTDSEKEAMAVALYGAWKRYEEFFCESPHGTMKQLRALLELIPKPEVTTGGPA